MDLDELLDQAHAKRKTGCRYCHILTQVTDDQADRLAQLAHTAVSDVLLEGLGEQVSDSTIGRHRRAGHPRG